MIGARAEGIVLFQYPDLGDEEAMLLKELKDILLDLSAGIKENRPDRPEPAIPFPLTLREEYGAAISPRCHAASKKVFLTQDISGVVVRPFRA